MVKRKRIPLKFHLYFLLLLPQALTTPSKRKSIRSFYFLGVAKKVEVDLSFNYLKDAANKRAGKKQPGDMRDLLVLRSDFIVLLDEYGLALTPGTLLKVSNEVQVKVNIVGYTAD